MAEKNVSQALQQIAGERASTSEFEGWFYRQDITPLPDFVKGFFKTTPSAVIRPETAEQVAQVLAYCRENGIPVTPRGAGSSGLFGAVPKKGGVVIDLTDLNKILTVDKAGQTVTAEAGAVWWQVEKELNKAGMTLLSYPSSAKSATLGGWIMTSGLGIGSLKYGPVAGYVIAAQMAMPDGKLVEVSGKDVRQYCESEGMLGVMTRVTLKVRPVPTATSHHLLYFKDIGQLFTAVKSLVAEVARPYNMEFLDGNYLTYLRQAGYPTTDFQPGGGTLLVTYDGTPEDVAEGGRAIARLARNGGEEREGAAHEWGERFKLFRVRRAAPGLLPSSVHVPVDRLGAFYKATRRMKKRPVCLAGYVVAVNDCNVMPMTVTGPATALRNVLALHTPRELSNLAIRLGGKPGGGTGVWNAPYRMQTLGKARLAEIRSLKKQLDPANIMNPGMYLDAKLVFRPAVYQAGMVVVGVADSVVSAGAPAPQPEGYLKELDTCIQCGYCMRVCPTQQGWLSSTPRGRILMSREKFLERAAENAQFAADYTKRLYQCTVCGKCGAVCSVDIKSRAMWQGTRHHMNRLGLVPESLKNMIAAVDNQKNIAGRGNDQRAAWTKRVKMPYDLGAKKTADVVYFVGCVTSFFPMAQPAARAFSQLLDIAGVDFTVIGGEEWCCGFPVMAAGDHDVAVKLVRHNIERVKDIGAKTIVTTCPGCFRVWKDEYREVGEQDHGLTVLHSTEYLADLLKRKVLKPNALQSRLTYHDPCDLGRNSHILDEPRYIINSIPGVQLTELAENREACNCCGSGGDLLASNQELSLAIARRKMEEVLATGAESAVTACPSCVRAMSMGKAGLQAKVSVLDITELLWEAVKPRV